MNEAWVRNAATAGLGDSPPGGLSRGDTCGIKGSGRGAAACFDRTVSQNLALVEISGELRCLRLREAGYMAVVDVGE